MKNTVFVRFLEVRTDEDLNDPPVFARVEFTEQILDEIHCLAGILQEKTTERLRLYTLNTFDYSPDWYEGPLEDWEGEYENFESAETLTEWARCKPVRMDAVTLNVCRIEVGHRNMYFWWEGYIKHTTMRCTTRRFSLEELDKWREW